MVCSIISHMKPVTIYITVTYHNHMTIEDFETDNIIQYSYSILVS